MYLSFEPPDVVSPRRPLYQAATQSLLEQGSGDINEDVLFEHGNVYGVFDGATSLDGCRFQDGLSGGLLAATIAAQAFQKSDCTLDLTAQKANQRIRELQLRDGAGLSERHTLWSTSCAVVRLLGNRIEYCQTGDAVIMLVLRDGSCRVITPDVDIDRETLHIWKNMQVESGMRIQEVLADQIRNVRLGMNISYGVLNGEPEALDFIRYGYKDLTDVSDILLFTDGLHLPRENPLAEHDWQSFVTLYRRGGLTAVRDHIRCLQQQDPECRKYPRFKVHDDIAAIAISC